MCRVRKSGRLAAVWVAFLVVAAFGLMSCTREVSGSPVKFSVDLGTVLLDADEIDDVMGTSGSEVEDEGNAPDDTIEANPPECHGLVYIAGEIEYGSTNFTAGRVCGRSHHHLCEGEYFDNARAGHRGEGTS